MRSLLAATGLALFLGCGGGGPTLPGGAQSGGLGQTGGTGGIPFLPGPNVLALIVDPGPTDPGYTNGLFASVTLCRPGTTECQTIDHLLVDTGSVGVRVLESLLTLELPDVVDASGQTLAECAPFVDGVAWGPLKTADVVLGGEIAAGLPIQLIGVSRYGVPSDCTGMAITDLDTLGTHGILGVGFHLQDCGSACALPASSRANYRAYYTCADAVTCSVASVPLSQQVSHPVAALPVNNNGVIIRLPGVGEKGAPSVPGQMVLGIGTQENNGLGDAARVDLDVYGDIHTTFPAGGSASYISIVDSGSNGLFFLDSTTTGLKMCTGGLKDFYCPPSTTNLSATISAATGGDIPVDFSVANASKLSASAFAFSNLAGAMPGYPDDPRIPDFDWGLPFFFGRTVYTAIEGRATPAGAGPFLAF